MLNHANTAEKADGNTFHETLEMLRSRNFRLLWIGEVVSVLGDQFTLIALPWLVLQLTGDALAMGTVLALAGVPRAIFMLLGGALTDRFSPRTTMIASNSLRLLLVASMAILILSGSIELWMLYAFALFFGLADAFYYPAIGTIVPMVVPEKRLQTGNAIVQGTARLSVFVGPLLAGGLIALLGNDGANAGENTPGLTGIGLSFAIDALSFAASVLTLWMMKIRRAEGEQAERGESASLLASIWEGLINVWNDKALRALFTLAVGLHLFATGPIFVGVPFLADTRYPEGAAALGIIMSAYGGGNFLGIVLAGLLPKPGRNLGSVLLALAATDAVALTVLGFASSTLIAALIVLAKGLAEGYILIQFTTWLQNRTARNMLGRMMSLLTFASVALVPISNALSGVLIERSAEGLFVGAAILLLLTVIVVAHSPAARSMGVEQGADTVQARPSFLSH